ncbi:hypothetical protein CP970_15570 [Streptomyces kanamyceticus]|uniref:Phospholipase n=1 Tax=Streptomyces kanamyceticus TaxID=1967 RepID=A0A5J6GCB5_STRKN|nr:phospholipase A2 [Streptomyces kanamyceticus]QEU92132.1 hypothetical protein CP970_15570 [Streptomyces kanamyceticus]
MRARNVLSKAFATVLTALLAVAVLPGEAYAGPASRSVADVRGEADRIMGLSRLDFINHDHIPPFDWDTDGCTFWPDGVFYEACAQHDFGYRNYGNHGSTHLSLSPTEETKAWLDERLHNQMRFACNENWPAGSASHTSCLAQATIIHDALSAGIGKENFF